MNRTRSLLVGFVASLVVAAAFWWRVWHRPSDYVKGTIPPLAQEASKSATTRQKGADSDLRQAVLTAAEKAARIERIRRDYDDIRSKLAAEYNAAGSSFPGGLNAFLQQLALLEQERRKDLLTVLTPRELEELEMRESHAGQLVQQYLGDSPATDDQRRAVFRLQRDFDDEYGWSFDLSPAFLLLRERARQQLQDQIRGVLGDTLFASWLRSEGQDFGAASDFVAQHALDPSVPFALWKLHNDFVLARLEVANQTGASPEDLRAAQAVLARRAEAQARALLGTAAADPGASAVLSWIPRQ